MDAVGAVDSHAVLAVSGGGMIIGLAGKKQVGKSTAAGFLVSAGFVRTSFAEPMKMMLQPLLLGMGVPIVEIHYYESHKEETIPGVGCSMRHLLQTLGTDWGRKLIGPDVWVKSAAGRIRNLNNAGYPVVIEDVRFENEAELIRSLGGLVIHIERDTGFSDRHASEVGIKFKVGDVLIDNNNAQLDALRAAVLGVAGVES